MILVLEKDKKLYYSYDFWEKTYVFDRDSLELQEVIEEGISDSDYDILDYIADDYELEFKLRGVAYEKEQ